MGHHSRLHILSGERNGSTELQIGRPDTLVAPASYVQANKHLPGIPSAGDVEKEGIELGDMNAKLLQKVETLTLLLIQQDERIKTLEQQIKKQ